MERISGYDRWKLDCGIEEEVEEFEREYNSEDEVDYDD